MLRTQISLSVDEALALSFAVGQAQQHLRASPDDRAQVHIQQQLVLDLAKGISAQAKSQLWQALKDLPSDHPVKQAHLDDEWCLDDSDLGGDEEMWFPSSKDELPPWIDSDHYFGEEA